MTLRHISTRAPGPPTDWRGCLPAVRSQVSRPPRRPVSTPSATSASTRRSGPGDDRRNPLRTQVGDQRERLRHGRLALLAGAGSPRWRAAAASGCPPSAATSRAARPVLAAASACGTVSGSRPRASSVRTPYGGTSTTAEIGRVDRRVLGPHDVAGLSGDHEPAEQGRGDVVGVALDPVGQRQRLRRRRAARRRRRPAPARARSRRRSRPRTNPSRGCAGSGWCRTAAGPGGCSPIASKAARMARTTRWDSSRATSLRPRPRRATSRPSSSDLADQGVAQLEGEAEAVVAGSEVGAGGRDLDGDRSGDERHVRPARPLLPRRRRRRRRRCRRGR